MSSLLESFYFLFEADASKVKGGLDAADAASDKLEKSLLSTDKVADKLGSSFVELAKNAGTALIGMLAWGAIKGMTTASAEATNAIADQAKAAKMSVNDFSALQGAVERAGGSTEGFASAMSGIADKSKNPRAELNRLANQMSKMSEQKAIDFGKTLGFDDDTVGLLRKGAVGIDDVIRKQKELGFVTAEQAETAKAYNQQQKDTTQVWDDIRRRIATGILPALTDFLKGLESIGIWMRDNKTFVVAFFGAVAAMITVFYLPAVLAAVTATYALLAPYLAVAAVVAALGAVLALVIDDVLAFLDGNNSVIGELSKKWPIVGEVVKRIAANFKTLWELMKTFADFVVNVFTVGPTEAFKKLGAAMGAMLDDFKKQFPMIGGLIDGVVEQFNKLSEMTGISLDDIINAVSVWFDAFKAIWGFLFDLITEGPTVALENLKTAFIGVFDKLVSLFPGVGEVVRKVSDNMADAAKSVGNAWEGLIAIFRKVVAFAAGAVDKIKSGARAVTDFLGVTDPEAKQGEPGKDGSNADAGEGITHRGDVPLLSPEDGTGRPPAVPLVAADVSRGMPPQTQQAVEAGKGEVAKANSEPLASISSSAISNSTSQTNKTTNVEVKEVNVQTQATDADGISKAIGSGLGDEMRRTVDQFDDGVAA